jgi:DNA-binding NarL/FixJ family response regulator
MFDVKVNGKVIAKAENEMQSSIYKLSFKGLKNIEIASALHIPILTVRRFTEGGATR